MKLLTIILKNFKILFRSKTSALIVFLGPLLLILLVGLAFNNAAQAKVSIGVYSSSYTELSESLLKKFRDNQYDVVKLSSEDECVNSLKYSTTHACLIFPADFKASADKRNEITFYVDYSEINLVYIILDLIGREVIQQSTDITSDFVSRLVSKIEETKLKLKAHKNILINFNSSEARAISQIDDVKSGINLINLSFDFNSLSVTSMVDKISDITDAADSLSSLLNDIKDGISGDNESSGIYDLIDDAKNQTEAIQEYLEGDTVTTTSNSTNATTVTKSLKTMLNGLTNSVYSIKSAVEKANVQKESVIQDLNKMVEIVETNFDYISDLVKETDDMLTNIETLKITNATVVAAPITTKIKSVTKEVTHFNYLFPLLISLTMMITAILLSSTIVINEKRSKAFFRNHISPTSLTLFNLGTYFTSLIVIGIQLLIFILAAAYIFKIDIMGNIGTTSLILFLMITLYIFLGMMVGSFFKSAETSALASISISSIFLFFSKAILPLENMPVLLRDIAQYNPFVMNIDLLKQSIFFNMSIDELFPTLKFMLVYIVVIALIILASQQLSKSYMLFRIHKFPAIQLKAASAEDDNLDKLKVDKKEEKK